MTRYATRFGPVELEPEQRWSCAEPLAGFEDLRDFALLQVQGQGPFLWLQSLDIADLAFLLVDAACFDLHYAPASGIDPRALGAPPCVMVILPPPGGDDVRVHRQAPLLFDVAAGTVRQQVVDAEHVLGSGQWRGPQAAQPQAWVQRMVALPAADSKPAVA